MDEATTITAPQSRSEVAPSARARGAVPVRWDRWFLVVAALFGTFLALATPPLQEHDAAAHLVRVDRMSRGTAVQPLDARGQASAEIDGCLRGFIDHHSARGGSGRSLDLRGNWTAVPCTQPSIETITASALTSPVPYLANTVGYAVVRAAGGGVHLRVLAARLTGLAAYVVAVWAAIRVAPKGRAVLFAVGVLPSSLALAAGVHADATGIALAGLAVALALRARVDAGQGVLAALSATLVALALSKNLYSPYVLLVLLIPAAAFAGAWSRRRYVGATAATAGVLVAAWASYVARIHYVGPHFGIDSEAARAHVAEHPFSFLRSIWNGLWHPFFREVTVPGIVEVLGGLRGPRVGHIYGDLAPLPVVAVALAVLALAVLADPGDAQAGDRCARRRTALVAGAIAGAGVLLIYLGMALTANPPGADALVWAQGRYFIPLVPLLALAAGRRVRHRDAIALAVPAGSLLLLAWLGWRVSVVFY